MVFFKDKGNRHLDEFDEEQRLYEAAAKEFDDGVSHPELRTAMFSEANENPDFARTRFIEERVRLMQQENNAANPGTAALQISTSVPEGGEEVLPPVVEHPQASTVVSSKDYKKLGGYVTLLLGLTICTFALLYLSLGGTQTGVPVLVSGMAMISVGLMLIIRSRKQGDINSSSH